MAVDATDFSATALKEIPKKQRKYGVCAWYVARNGRDIKHVPQHHRTVHMLMLAVGSYPKAYLLASLEVRSDPQLTTLAVRRGGVPVWKAVPLKLVDETLCLAAVKGCGGVLGYIPSPFRSYDVCKAACVAGGARIEDIPAEFISAAFFEGVALPNVPMEYRSRRRCRAGVQQKGNYLRYVPSEVVDYDLVKCALRSDPWAYRYVPQRFHDSRFYKEARRKLIGHSSLPEYENEDH